MEETKFLKRKTVDTFNANKSRQPRRSRHYKKPVSRAFLLEVEMFEKFTETALHTIMSAQDESRRLNHNFVGTEQILLGVFYCPFCSEVYFCKLGILAQQH